MLDAFPRTVRYLNRELSWLDFNARVLALSEDTSQRLLERLKFLAIFASNLDEFFQVRVAGLQEQRDAGVGPATPEGLTPDEQLAGIRERVVELSSRADALWSDELRPELEKERLRIIDWKELDESDREHLGSLFRERVFPVLTPLSVDPAHPFPYISSLSLNLAALVRDPASGERRFARVKVPPLLPRFVELPDGERFVPIEQVIAAHLEVLFPGMEIVGHSVFRLTRDADFELEEDEGGDLLEAIESVLRRRLRGATPVRLEVDAAASEEVRTLLMRELALLPDEVYLVRGLLDPSALWSLHDRDRPELKDEPWTPVTQSRLEGADDVFRVMSNGDLLVHHPYDSFETSVEAFIEQAAQDPAVLAIKLALYRTSEDSPIVQALVSAAEAGKQVVALVELQARFDERANITQARTLEQAGVHVVYGIVGLKTHAKVCLVVRREDTGIRRYTHVGTGNYNPSTARLYEDVGAALGGSRGRGRPERPFQPAHRLQSSTPVSTAPGGACHAQDAADRAHPGRGCRRGRLDRPEDEQPRGSGDGRGALRSLPGGGAHRAAGPRDLLLATRASPGSPTRSGSDRSSVGSSSTRGSSGSAIANGDSDTSSGPRI